MELIEKLQDVLFQRDRSWDIDESVKYQLAAERIASEILSSGDDALVSEYYRLELDVDILHFR